MRKPYTSVRGIITTKPKLLKDRYSKKEILFFCVGFVMTNKEDGKRYQVKVNIAVKEHRLNERLEIKDFLTRWASVGDIVRIWGKKQKVIFYNTKPIVVLTAKKFKYLWCNKLLADTIAQERSTYIKVSHPNKEDKEQLKNYLISAYKGDKDLIKMLTPMSVAIKDKSQKDKAQRLIYECMIHRGTASRYYLNGDKYRALAVLWLIRYIFYVEMPSHSRKMALKDYGYLLACDFKEQPKSYITI